jgi:hypothetical protein
VAFMGKDLKAPILRPPPSPPHTHSSPLTLMPPNPPHQPHLRRLPRPQTGKRS